MFLEGVLLELAMIFLTSKLQKDLEVELLKATSSWFFICNVITSGFQTQATIADITTIWSDYEIQREVIEKPLKAVHLIPFTSSDNQWVYENIDVEDKLEVIIQKIELQEGVAIVEKGSNDSNMQDEEKFSQTFSLSSESSHFFETDNNFGPVICDDGHQMSEYFRSPYHEASAVDCDICQKSIKLKEGFWHCVTCEVDFCTNCGDSK